MEPLTDEPDVVFASGRRVFGGTTDGDLAPEREELRIVRSRPFKGGWLVVVDAVPDRATAERWRDRYWLVPSAELRPLAEGEVYLHDLPGLAVELTTGETVGEVIDVYELPQGVVVDVRRERGTVLLPFNDTTIVEVDLERRRLVVDPPPGLLE